MSLVSGNRAGVTIGHQRKDDENQNDAGQDFHGIINGSFVMLGRAER